MLECLQDLLESAGYTVRLFPSAAALLENDGLASIDCLISDIVMPVMDGLQLRRTARSARPDLPVILMTGRQEIAERQSSLVPQDQPLFLKPFVAEQMLAAVGKALSPPVAEPR